MRKSKIVVLFAVALIFVLSGCNKEAGKEFYSDGSLKGKGPIQSDGKKEGTWKYFYGNGLMMSEGEYKDGYKDGKWKYWDKNGKLITVRDHKKEELHTTEMAGAEDAAHKAESAQTGKAKAEPAKAAAHKTEAPAEEAPAATAGEASAHKEEPASAAPLAATMEEWKAKAAAKKGH